MSTLTDFIQRLSGKSAVRVLAVLFVLGSGAALHAAPAPQSPDRPPATAQERGDLRRTIEARYQVLPVSGGVLLTPRQPKAGVRTVEVTGDRIAVNGETVTARTVRDWLGADADPVLRLLGMTANEQRQLFGLGAEAASQPPAAAPETSAEPPTSDTDVTETSVEPSETPEPPETPEAPAPPSVRERHSSGSRVNVGGSVTVDKDETADEAVAVGGSVDVEGEVHDQVTAVGGPVRIQGRVGGEVVSVGSSVYLGPHAVVDGDVTSIGGNVHREPGAVIHGAVHEVGLFPFMDRRGFHRGPIWSGGHWGIWGGVSGLLSSLMRLLLAILFTSLVVLVARRPLERVDRKLAGEPWPSAAVGVASAVFFLPLFVVVTVLLIITIVGCFVILLYPFLFLYLFLLALLGYTAVAYRLGRLLEGRFNRSLSPYAAVLTGVLALEGWRVLGALLGLLPWPISVVGFLTSLFGALLGIAATLVGFGAVVLSRFGLEPGYWPRRGAPPVVPPPSQQVVEPLPLSDPHTNPPPTRWEE